jgi:hypothetical protein
LSYALPPVRGASGGSVCSRVRSSPLALLSKSAGIWLIPVFVLAAFGRARSLGDRRAGLRFLLWAGLLPLLFAAWWYLRNLVLYGDLFQMQAQIETYTHSMRRTPLSPVFFEVLFEDLWRTFFGFGTQLELLPRPWFYIYAAGLGVVLLGLWRLLRSRQLWQQQSAAMQSALPLALLGSLVMLALSVIGNLSVPSAQGRYLYPVLPALLTLVAGGLRAVAPEPGRRPIGAPVLLLFWLAMGVFGFYYAVLPRHAVQDARARGEGGVHQYIDCGSPAGSIPSPAAAPPCPTRASSAECSPGARCVPIQSPSSTSCPGRRALRCSFASSTSTRISRCLTAPRLRVASSTRVNPSG